MAQQKLIQLGTMRWWVWSVASLWMGQGSGVAERCDVCRTRGLDPVLLWLWFRLAAAALIWPLAWEAPYATGTALKRPKKKKKKKRNKHHSNEIDLIFYPYALQTWRCPLSLHISSKAYSQFYSVIYPSILKKIIFTYWKFIRFQMIYRAQLIFLLQLNSFFTL